MVQRVGVGLFVGLMFGSCGVTEPDVERLLVTVAVSPSEIRPGELMDITVRASNVTNHALEFTSNSCVLELRVLDGTGTEVYPGSHACLDILRVHHLAPGEYLEETFDFDGRGRRGRESDYERYPLSPGSYWVEGSVTSAFASPSEHVQIRIASSGK